MGSGTNVILEEPRTVLLAGECRPLLDGRELPFSAADAVARVDTGAAALAELDDREDVGCVAVDAVIPDDEPLGLCERLVGRASGVPVVVSLPTDRPELAQRALEIGVDRCFTADESLEAACDRIDDVLAAYVERRLTRERADMFDALMENSEPVIYFKDREGRHLATSSLPPGMDRSEVIGRTDLDVYDDNPDRARDTYEDDLSVIESGTPLVEKEEVYGPEEHHHWALTSKLPWRDDDGTVKGLFGFTRDITESKRTEQRLADLESRIEAFTGYLRHDMQTPLQIASGSIELARESGDVAVLDKADYAIERIEQIVGDIEAQFASDGQVNPAEQSVAIVSVIEEIWGGLATDATTLEIDLPDTTKIRAPEETLRPIFENLFKNAIDHAGPDVTVRVDKTRAGGFYVADDGPGIPADERDAVTETGYTTSSEGTGQGLAIVSQTTDAAGWDLRIDESRAGGARFEVNNCLVVFQRPSVTPGETVALTEQTALGTHETEGSAAYDEARDRWSVVGGGTDIYDTDNDFYYVYATVGGPVSIRGRITDVQHINDFSKAVFMVRDQLTTGSSYGAIGRTPEYGSELLCRRRGDTPGRSQQLDEVTPFERYRIDLVDGAVTCYVSTDGSDWTAIDQRTIEYTEPVTVGLAVCSVVPGRLCEAVFESVEVTRLVADGS